MIYASTRCYGVMAPHINQTPANHECVIVWAKIILTARLLLLPFLLKLYNFIDECREFILIVPMKILSRFNIGSQKHYGCFIEMNSYFTVVL